MKQATKIKLTARQLDLLLAMAGGVRVHYQRYMGSFCPNAYYFRTDTRRKCTREAVALFNLGLFVDTNPSRFESGPYKLSGKGRKLAREVKP